MEVLKCSICKFNNGDDLFPICKYEEIDEENGYMNVSSKQLDTMYTEECVRYETKRK